MAKLWIHVKEASVDIPDSSGVVATLKVGSSALTTTKAEAPNPVWNEDFQFTVKDINEPLTVEIYQSKLLSKTLLGLTTIPLYNVRHSNKLGEGHWNYLFLPTTSGKLLPTQHQIHLDTHFELPEGLGEEEAAELDRKLQLLDSVLEKEIEVIENQHHRLVTGDLDPPVTHHKIRSESSSSTEPPLTPPTISITPPDSGEGSFDEMEPLHKPARSRVNAIHEGMITPLHSDSDGEIECSETRAKWKSVFKNPKFQTLLLDAKRNSKSGPSSLAQLVSQLKTMGQSLEQDVKPLTTVSTAFLSRSRSVIERRRQQGRHFIADDLRMQVYRKTVQALIHPVSESQKHKFEKWSAHKPTVCSECNYPLWGLTKQGVKCSKCSKICHERCATLATQDCLMDNAHAAVCGRMQRTLANHPLRFKTLREAFNVSEEDNKKILDEIKDSIMHFTQNFGATITVKVLAAQGLNLAKFAERRVYVTVTIGNTKRKTKVHKSNEEEKYPPQWPGEEFVFHCSNYHDTIQIRVWNERNSTLAQVVRTLTKEGDVFLGEKIIEIKRMGPPRDIWFKLMKRTEDSEVSGYLKLNVSSLMDGEKTGDASYHEQYLKLHEQMFFHVYLHEKQPLKEVNPKPDMSDGSSGEVQLFPTVAQEILDEFALSYSIDPIYRMMIHMELLVDHHSLKKALSTMGNLFKNLKYQMFVHVAAENTVRAVGVSKLMEEYLNASNYGRDNFSKVLDRLMSSLKLDLQQYREFYPCNDKEKLTELAETCQLMSIVVEFQQQAMGFVSIDKLEDDILENMQECMKSTFEFIVQNCVPEGSEPDQHPGLNTAGKPFQFFYDLIRQIRSVIFEDREIYGPTISQFVSFNLGDVSAVEMWRLFGTIINKLFDKEANNELFPPNEYMQLFYKVKVFYESTVRDLPSMRGQIPEYPRWFLPCTRRWLQVYQKEAISFVDNAWDDDRDNLQFAGYENQLFTSSTYQMFFHLHECHQGLSLMQSEKPEFENTEVKHENLYEFALVIRNVVQHYVDKVSRYIPECVDDLTKVCMLLNNLQALRVNVQSLFEEMGGAENVGSKCSDVLSDFQANVLAKELSSWCTFIARSITPNVLQGTALMHAELLKLKGQGGDGRTDAKAIQQHLLTAIYEKCSIIAANSEHLVLQKVIKVVWFVVQECFHHMLLPMLKWDQEGVPPSCSVQFPPHNYSSRQCTALEMVLESLKAFFSTAENLAIKQLVMDKGLKQLRGVISLYRQTTEMLIKDFIVDEIKHVRNTDALCGEVFLEINATMHPITGELEGSIRVVSASNLKFCSGGTLATGRGLKPYIELNLICPSPTTRQKRKFKTRQKTTASPNFNDTFQFSLPSLDNTELQVVARNHTTFGTDKIIGVALVSFSLVHREGNLTLGLSPSIPVSDRGQALLNVLSVRTNDDFAKEFVELKMNQQIVEDLTGQKEGN